MRRVYVPNLSQKFSNLIIKDEFFFVRGNIAEFSFREGTRPGSVSKWLIEFLEVRKG